MTDAEYIGLLEGLFQDALQEIERLKKTVEECNKQLLLERQMRLTCLQRQRQSLFLSQN